MVFNNGLELQTDFAKINPYDFNLLELSIILEKFEDAVSLKELFSNRKVTEKIVDGDNVFEGFVNLKMFYIQYEDNGTRVYASLRHESLENELTKLKEENQTLTDCLLEMSELLYN